MDKKKKAANIVFTFKYFRFRCLDITKTIDFYKSCGMNIEEEGFVDQVVDLSSNSASITRKELVVGGSKVVTFSFPRLTSTHSFLLIFEQLQSAELQYGNINRSMGEYMVIYVKTLSKVLHKLAAKQYTFEIHEFDNVKVALVCDPNLINVRLIEMSEEYLNHSSQMQWFARLGYYVIPTDKADDTVLLYESLFETRAVIKKVNKDLGHESEQPKVRDPFEVVKKALKKGTSFKTVDMDNLVVGLTESVFYWMGNDMRAVAPSICFNEVRNADTGQVHTKHNHQDSPLIGIGFEVGNLEMVVQKLKNETKDGLIWEASRYKIGKSGIVTKFRDPFNHILLEIFAAKVEVPPPPVKSRFNAQRTLPPLAKVEVLQDEGFMIDLNHLKGHTRSLSAGSIISAKERTTDHRLAKVPEESNLTKILKQNKKLLQGTGESSDSIGLVNGSNRIIRLTGRILSNE